MQSRAIMWMDFVKTYPGGNPTVLLDGRGHSNEQWEGASIARRVMREPSIGGEQVGYLVSAHDPKLANRLEMMGGELCINAIRSAAKVLSEESGNATVEFEASGVPGAVRATVAGDDVEICFKASVSVGSLETDLWLVELAGIAHFVVRGRPDLTANVAEFSELLDELRHRYNARVGRYCALGLIRVDDVGADLRILPLVYVGATGTSIMESACGSGSVAAAIVAGRTLGVYVEQPSGDRVFVCVTEDEIRLTGVVRTVAQGTLDVGDIERYGRLTV